ncbi:Tim18p NDAI_0E00660 [Naumovozyma dairenensis CBS 421]|uniref:Succinate dehydrogenase [ubiquinone] cytochrome b small subunit n=1 Tax=Naumovozyma dairenensis (strain ATCC 10597 / BCRC 20456 / CBS 421 / NBRC 0211 / NRRL Y-12639) TaxID=1071378 RepID=G0WAW2_NAUDC|nr:hypothetical protein NDAI_0E00660 [Naumovozyma dairenensis CBS 421]CCD24882.1 hypothetical protein NDAI_0E00660 [Naumovozyma dairenensis CBS 421]
MLPHNSNIFFKTSRYVSRFAARQIHTIQPINCIHSIKYRQLSRCYSSQFQDKEMEKYIKTGTPLAATSIEQDTTKPSSLPKTFTLPKPSQVEGSYHEEYEKIAKYSLLPLSLVPFVISMAGGVVPPLLDTALATTFLIYIQYGFTSCIIEYLPKEKFHRWHNAAKYLLYSFSSLSLYGIYQLETENNGLIDLISKLWQNDNDSNLYIFGRN